MTRACTNCSQPPRRDTSGNSIPLKKCTRCQAAAYHDRDCQKADYKRHRPLCRPNPIDDERHGRGKCLLARTDYRFGVSIADYGLWEPFAAPVLFHERRFDHCAVCFTPVDPPRPSCTYYPVLVCSLCDRKQMDDEVKAAERAAELMNASASIHLLPTALLVARLIIFVAKGHLTMEDLLVLHSHKTHQPPEHRLMVQQMATSLIDCWPLDGPSREGASDLVNQIPELLPRIQLNAFTIEDVEGNSLGLAIFQRAHYMNHSCTPNVRQAFVLTPGKLPRLRLTACAEIEASDELCISYVDNCAPQKQRQAGLDAYGFVCHCERCVDPKLDSPVLGLRCQMARCTGTLYQQDSEWICLECGKAAETGWPESEMQRAEQTLASGSYKRMQSFFDTWSDTFVSSSYYIRDLTDRLARMEIESLSGFDEQSFDYQFRVAKILLFLRTQQPPRLEDWTALPSALVIYRRHKIKMLTAELPDRDDLRYAKWIMEMFLSRDHIVFRDPMWHSFKEKTR